MPAITKVVTLLTEMKATTVKEGEDDLEAYDKYKCWCITTEKEKSDAIEAAETKLEELGSFVEEAAAKEGELKTEIAGLEEDIASDTDALKTATALRAKENEEFLAEEADVKETLGLLSEAIGVLSKVQLVQTRGGAQTALVQVKQLVHRIKPKFQNVMQKDLFDMLGSFQGAEQIQQKKFQKDIAFGSFLGEVFLPKKEAAALAQDASLPWIKTEEQLGKEAKPNSENGAAAGAKSYNSRSGGILGLLKEQGDKFAEGLASSQKEELQALEDFQKLKAAKMAEISAATEQKDAKESQLAELMDKAAKAKEDIEATTAALTADQEFLAEAQSSCATEDAEYAKRVKVRTEEIKAIGETLDILTGDEARSLFDKTLKLLQTGAVSRFSVQEQVKQRSMMRIMSIAKKHRNWALASLAVKVKLDAFTKVKAAMDKMLAELKAQQAAEYEKWEVCKKDIDTTEDDIKVGLIEKRDLATKHKDIVNSLEALNADIAELTKEVADMEVSLKKAGEQRKAENQLFQTSVADQRATVTILNMALDRLKKFYALTQTASLVEIRAHSAANPPPKPSTTGYEKSGSSGGVMQLISMIIEDAGRTEAEMLESENVAQKDYASYVAATTASIEADRKAISEKEEQVATAEGAKAETEESQLANGASLEKLDELLKGLHLDCDYVIKYFDLRQQSRKEEMEAIEEAKAILSGAKFS